MTDERGTVISNKSDNITMTVNIIVSNNERDKNEKEIVGVETGCLTHLHILSFFLIFHHLLFTIYLKVFIYSFKILLYHF